MLFISLLVLVLLEQKNSLIQGKLVAQNELYSARRLLQQNKPPSTVKFNGYEYEVHGGCLPNSAETIRDQFPGAVQIQLVDPEQRMYTFCSGALISKRMVLTAAMCGWMEGTESDFREHNSQQIYSDILKMIAVVGPKCRLGKGEGRFEGKRLYVHENFTGAPEEGYDFALITFDEDIVDDNYTIPQITQQDYEELVDKKFTVVSWGSRNSSDTDDAFHSSIYPYKHLNYTVDQQSVCQRVYSSERGYQYTPSALGCIGTLDNLQGLCYADAGAPIIAQGGELVGIVGISREQVCGVLEAYPHTFGQAKPILPWIEQVQQVEQENALSLPLSFSEECEGQEFVGADRYPFLVSVQIQNGIMDVNDTRMWVSICAGTLLSPNKVLTAAQCLWYDRYPIFSNNYRTKLIKKSQKFGIPQQPLSITLQPKCRHQQGNGRILVKGYLIHPNYTGNPNQGYDAAILSLESNASISAEDLIWNNQAAKLPAYQQLQRYNESMIQDVYQNISFYSLGWGAMNKSENQQQTFVYNRYVEQMKVTQMSVASVKACDAKVVGQDPRDFMDDLEPWACMKHDDAVRFCAGDAGNPLIAQTDDGLVLYGMNTWKVDVNCQQRIEEPEIFTRVSAIQKWIQFQLDPSIQEEIDVVPSSSTTSSGLETWAIILLVIMGVIVVAVAVTILYFTFRYRRSKDELHGMEKLHTYEAKKLSDDFSDNFKNEFMKIYNMLGQQQLHQIVRERRNSVPTARDDSMLQPFESDATISKDDEVLYKTRKQNNFSLNKQLTAYNIEQNNKTNQNSDTTWSNGMMMNQMVTSPFATDNNDSMDSDMLSRSINQYCIAKKPSTVDMATELQNQLKQYRSNLVYSQVDEKENGIVTWNKPIRDEVDVNIDFDNDIKLFDLLGQGAFGRVYRAEWQMLNQRKQVAVKLVHQHVVDMMQMDSMGSNTLYQFVSEFQFLCRLQSNHVVKLFGVSLKPPNVALVLEYMSGGNLDTYIHKRGDPIPLSTICQIGIGIARGLSSLHPTVVHRDLKPQNVLLELDEKGNILKIKLADFGLSKMKENTFFSETQIKGTPQYIAPEAFNSSQFNEQYDMYALGVILWEMIAKDKPWRGLKLEFIYGNVMQGKRPEIPPTCPEALARFINRCWSSNPQHRPSADQADKQLQLIRMKLNADYKRHHNNSSSNSSNNSSASNHTTDNNYEFQQ